MLFVVVEYKVCGTVAVHSFVAFISFVKKEGLQKKEVYLRLAEAAERDTGCASGVECYLLYRDVAA